MATKQQSEDFRIEDWAIPEAELPWNATPRQQSRFQSSSSNIVELDQYRRRGRDKLNGGE